MRSQLSHLSFQLDNNLKNIQGPLKRFFLGCMITQRAQWGITQLKKNLFGGPCTLRCCRCGQHDGDRVERRHAPLLLRLLPVHPVPPPIHREGKTHTIHDCKAQAWIKANGLCVASNIKLNLEWYDVTSASLLTEQLHGLSALPVAWAAYCKAIEVDWQNISKKWFSPNAALHFASFFIWVGYYIRTNKPDSRTNTTRLG